MIRKFCEYIFEITMFNLNVNPNLFRDYNRAVVLKYPRTLTILDDNVDADVNKIQRWR